MKIWSVLSSAAVIALVSAGLRAAPAAESVVVWPDKADVMVADAVTMKFDLSHIPAGAVIQYATLNMNLAQSDGRGDNYALSTHKILRIDSENHATLSQPYDTQGVNDAPGFRAWTMTRMVQEWLASPATNLGVELDADAQQAPNHFRAFASMESTDASRRPFLQITYSTPDSANGAAPAPGMIARPTTSASSAPSASSARSTFSTAPAASGSDSEKPSVSIAGPSPRVPLSGIVTLQAHASDNVGVVRISFKIDGAEVADASQAPFATPWDSATVPSGAHTLTAIAYDAAGNAAESAAVKFTMANKELHAASPRTGASGGTGGGGTGGGGGGGTNNPNVVFDSAWDTASGTSNSAVTDGGRWPNYWEFNHGTNVQLLTVVTGGPRGHNALRVQQRGAGYAANVQINDVVPQGKDYYLRFYMKNEDSSGSGDHVVTVDTWKYANLTFMRKSSSPNGWTFKASLYGCGYTYPVGHWGPAKELALGQWYRFEYWVHYVDPTHIQLHPRVYDDKGNLIFSDAEYTQTDPGIASWNGRADWTLASYYAAGNSFCLGNPESVNDIGLGNNGQQGSDDSGKYWYFGGIQVRTDTWPGDIATRGSADTASLPSGDVEGVRQQTEQPGAAEGVANEPLRSPRSGKAIPRAEAVPQTGDGGGPVVAGQHLPNSDAPKSTAPEQPAISPRTVNPGPVRDTSAPASNAVRKSSR